MLKIKISESVWDHLGTEEKRWRVDCRVTPGVTATLSCWRKDTDKEMGDVSIVWYPGSQMKRVFQILLRGWLKMRRKVDYCI